VLGTVSRDIVDTPARQALRVKNPFSAASERIANGAPITTTSRAAGKVADEWSQEHKPDDDETV